MRKDLDRRLRKVAQKMSLVERLRKVALATEEEMIDRMAERSKKVLLDVRGKFTRAFKALLPSLPEEGQKALNAISEQIARVVTDSGVVDTEALDTVKSDSEALWKTLSQSSRGSTAAMYFFMAFERFLTVAMLGSRLQNHEWVESAKNDPRYRDRLYKAMEQLAKVIPQVQAALQKAQSQVPVEAPPEAAPAADSSALEAVQQQLNEAEREMRGVVDQISRLLVAKAGELFGTTSELSGALEDNIMALYSKRKINPELNRNKEFYQEALHLELGSQKLDLGEFLDSKSKKALYLSYRSFVMAARALGVMQFAQKQPELVMKSPKAQELVMKAQQILQKRKDVIVGYLRALKKSPKKTEPDKERGIPKGTFSDFFGA